MRPGAQSEDEEACWLGHGTEGPAVLTGLRASWPLLPSLEKPLVTPELP